MPRRHGLSDKHSDRSSQTLSGDTLEGRAPTDDDEVGTGGALARNTLLSGLSSASSVLLLVLVVVAARVLGDRAFGVFSFALSAATIAEMFIDFGICQLAARDLARDKESTPGFLRDVIGWKLVTSAIVMGAFTLSLIAMRQTGTAFVVGCAMGVAAILRSHKYTTTAIFQAHERFDLILLTIYTERISVLVGGIAALLIWRSLTAFSLAFVLARIPDIIFSFGLLHTRVARIGTRFSIARMLPVQVAAWPFGVYSLVTVAYSNISTIILAEMSSVGEVGFFGAGAKVYEGLQMLPYLVGAALLPRLSRIYVTDPGRFSRTVGRACKYMAAVAIPTAAAMGVAAPALVELVFGREYLPATPAVRALLAASVPMCLSGVLRTVLVSANGEKPMLRIGMTSVALLAVSCAVLTPRLGATGAAISVALSETVGLVLLAIRVSKDVTLLSLPTVTWRPLLACSASLVVAMALSSSAAQSMIAFAGAYVAAPVALGVLDKDDAGILGSLLPSFTFTKR